MKRIKFPNPNLIVLFVVVFFSFAFVLPKNRANAQHYAVQLAASKELLDIAVLAKKFGISDTIRQIVGKDWNRYVVGNFETNKMAGLYAADLMAKTGLKGAFPRLIEDDSKNEEELEKTDRLQALEPPVLFDTVKTETNKAEVKIQPTKKTGVVSAVLKSEKNTSNNLNNGENEEEIVFSYAQRNLMLKFLFGEARLKIFKHKLLNYGNLNLSTKRQILYTRFVNQIFNYPIIIAFSTLILIFIIHIVLLLILLSYTNKIKNYYERYIRIFSALYETVVLSYVFREIDWDTFYAKLKYINRPLNRKILISILLNFNDNLKGSVDVQIPEIYSKMNLKNDSIKLIDSFLYYKKVKGLHELTNLCPEAAKEIIPKLLQNSNESIRAEAQKSFILLNPDKPFDFLRSLKKPFSRWTQLSAFHLLRLPQLQIPSFSRYLLSSHNGVRIFCLQMINYFQQLENVDLIFNLVESNKELTRFLSYRAINNLRLYDGRVLIKKQYRDETEKNKLEIIKALRKIGTNEDIDFLEIIFKSESTALQLEACRSMYYMSSESNKRVLNVSKKIIPNLDLFIAHVTDKRN